MFPSPLVCRPAPSRTLRGGVVVVGLLAILAVGLADLSWSFRALALAVTAVGVMAALRVRPPVGLRCGTKGKLEVALSEDGWTRVQPMAGAALPFMLVLRYRHPGERFSRSLALGRDSLPSEDFRRLAVWLRWRVQATDRKPGDGVAGPVDPAG